MKNLFLKYLFGVISSTIGLGIFVAIFLADAKSDTSTWVFTFLIVIILSSYLTHRSIVKKISSIINSDYKKELSKIQYQSNNQIKELHTEIDKIKEDMAQCRSDEQIWKQSLLERNSGFKTLLKYICEYEKLRDNKVSDYLENKRYPAPTSAEIVKDESRKRRKAESENKRTQSIIEMYEQYAPFLVDLKDDVPDISDIANLREYSEEEKFDIVTNYISKIEYRKLSTVERNQLALDNFWARKKSNWLLGKLYERYIGYLYEQKGYQVEYFGISEKYEDLGRDLICHKANETLIIQCKNWGKFKTIYEKHIFQLFGTSFVYKEQYPSRNISALFYTTTQLSEVAKKIAQKLEIKLFEQFKFDKNYPCIKCNINSSTKEKIYHLPFDQKYDQTKINRKGEKYCKTVKEAEQSGFRRALKWQSPE